MEGHMGSKDGKWWYCEALLAEEELCPNRFIQNHAGYVTLNTLHSRQYFDLMVQLYDILTQFHARRVNTATAWLERRELTKPTHRELLRPHTPEWFASLREWNPKQAAMTEAAIQTAESSEVCSVCADDPAHDYALLTMPAAGPGTLRLCDDCFRIRSRDEPMEPF